MNNNNINFLENFNQWCKECVQTLYPNKLFLLKSGGLFIQSDKKGNKIHIKKKNRGKFTDYCGGKVTSACISKGKNSPNPTIRKRATFAQNSRRWKHQEGGTFKKLPPYINIFYSDVKTPMDVEQLQSDLNRKFVEGLLEKGVDFNNRRQETDKKGIIPYIPEKSIKLTNAGKDTGVTISTNMLDSIAKYAKQADISLQSALGLAGQESTFGVGYGYNKRDVEPSVLISNWNYTGFNNNASENPYDGLFKYVIKKVKEDTGKYSESGDYIYNPEYIKVLKAGLPYAKKMEKILGTDTPVLLHGFIKYKQGKYNPADPNHTKMVEDRGKVLMKSPEIQKWMKSYEK